ncbi:Uu.00g123260.m01.CDS01 [Anthostomella pinea]|uniref:Uu.00g123260.m01.CDS01 n=1 Tax=Anthostomella pinea TaxID=933095 RepID=A0AAI8VHD8_9PEZI|nr:Uu.00g123260.m01.CDS01 [Anthostomella pinea]
MEPYGDVVMPYELMTPAYSGTSPDQRLKNLRNLQEWLQSPEQAGGVHDNLSVIVGHLLQSIEGSQSHFLQFDAPLSLLLRACQFNRTRSSAAERIKQLYVAQSNLSNLPQPLSEDLPVPAIVRHAGKGDIYDSSVWLGLQPTYTPLHRDPNPNLFCQMVGSKTVRLMRPQSGAALYACVRRQLGSMGSSRFRGSEMMDGPERELLHRAVWANAEGSNDVKQARLGPGDALFIPKGWWHSVASTGHEAELNASVNWWFR